MAVWGRDGAVGGGGRSAGEGGVGVGGGDRGEVWVGGARRERGAGDGGRVEGEEVKRRRWPWCRWVGHWRVAAGAALGWCLEERGVSKRSGVKEEGGKAAYAGRELQGGRCDGVGGCVSGSAGRAIGSERGGI